MENKKTKILWLIAGIIITIISFLPVAFSDYQEYTISLITSSPYLAPFVIIFFRFIGVVLAPLPGSPISFASIVILPWHEAWLWNFIGMELGSITAFIVARKFREPVVARFAPLDKIHQWQGEISKKRQFWGFAGLRVVTLVAFDFVSYAAGLTKLPFRTFIIASFLVDIPASLLFFYFGGLAVRYSIFILGGLGVIFILSIFIWNRLQARKEV